VGILYVAGLQYRFCPSVSPADMAKQAAVYENLDGVHGMSGWRWLYIICGVMTLPVGIVTAFFFPDTPHITRAFFLSREEKELGLARAQNAGKAAPAPLSFSRVARVLKGWRASFLSPVYAYLLAFINFPCRLVASGSWLCRKCAALALPLVSLLT
jgi:MFS transporter, ACS family, pantothenate transporter